MARTSKSTTIIQRLLDERRQYEAWITRLGAAEDATPEAVRTRVKADYEARLKAVTEELKAHADSARQTMELRQHARMELQQKETHASERLSEAELRHAVGEYDDAQWSQVHKDVLAELVVVREELQAVDADIAKLEELVSIVRASPRPAPRPAAREPAAPPAPAPAPAPVPPAVPKSPPRPAPAPAHLDELAFIKSVTEDEKGAAPSPKRASGAQFQPVIPEAQGRTAASPASATPPEPEDRRTLKCRDCGTMNLPTEWYCEQCGAELAAL
ncbi:MAG TPA: hypothetical protein VN848_04745 [Gemmatimonadales bacterium]|nr:hypothetical protein [Gemmatimonadales bacterium]